MHPSGRLRRAVEIVRAGGLIAHPTEGVYGLACDPRQPEPLLGLLAIKQRPAEKGMILVASSWLQLAPYVAPLSADELQLPFSTWPGAVTWLLPAADKISPLLCGAHPTIAVRITNHPLTRTLCDQLASAIVSTSANPAGRPAARSALRVHQYFGRQLDLVLNGPLGGRSGPSEIRELSTGRLLRS